MKKHHGRVKGQDKGQSLALHPHSLFWKEGGTVCPEKSKSFHQSPG